MKCGTTCFKFVWVFPALLLTVTAGEFTWKLCDNDDSDPASLRITSLSLHPDPLSRDAYAYVDFTAELTRNMTGPVTLSLSINKIVNLFWLMEVEIGVPCFSWLGNYGVGSCTYDACEVTAFLERTHGCPSEFTANGIPCSCPLRPGAYSTSAHPRLPVYLDTSSVPLVPETFLTGHYRTSVQLSDATGSLACFEYTTTIN